MPSSEAAGAARLLTALVVWAAAVAGALLLTMVVAHSIHPSTPSGIVASHAGGLSQRTFNPSSVRPTDRRSLFVGTNFPRVLRVVRAHLGPRTEVQSVRIAPGEAQFIVIRSGREHFISARTNGDYNDLTNGSVTSATEVFDLSQVRADVPAALARRIARHGGVPISRLDYMVIATNPVEHTFSWDVYPKNSAVHFQADNSTSPIQAFGPSGSRTLNG